MQKEVTGQFQSATKKEDNSDIYQKFTKNNYSTYRTLFVCDQYPPSLFLNQYNKQSVHRWEVSTQRLYDFGFSRRFVLVRV
jgi:hypothetical protein